ncbi:MAG: hypothetical protein CL840_13460 [Crocinitomicaceae bacterium]|nr:hypothetical protein [Crocinitomicaceae bacterium]|tara:strand:- start:15557 stop:16354 length:798 start_codon:yes stop_codon:yes gene_type:complete
MRPIKSGILAILLLSFFTNCSNKGCTDSKATNYSSSAKKDDGSCIYAAPQVQGIKYRITSVMAHDAFSYNKAFQNIDGNYLLFTKCQLYIGNPQGVHAETGKFAYPENVLLVTPEVKDYTASAASNGYYTDFKFQFGIDPSLNNSKNPSDYAAGSAMGAQTPSMYRGGTDKYTFLLLEGKFDSDGDEVPDKDFKYHVGADKYAKMITEYDSEFQIINNGSVIFDINMNWPYFLAGIDMNSNPSSLSTDATSDKIMENLELAFQKG